jgi:hypothetical protein
MYLLRKLYTLKPAGRRMLFQAACALTLIAPALRVFGFARVYAALARMTGQAPAPANPAPWVRRTRHLIQFLARHGPYRGNCLSRSLVLWGMLRRRGIDSDLRIGVRTDAARFQAHAWVEYQGQPLNASEQIHQQYAAFDQAIVPEGAQFP